MTDIFDRAQQIEQMQRDIALRKQRAQTAQATSAFYCEDCGEPISEQRRKLINGVIRCVTCQGIYEQKMRNFRR